MRWSRRGWLVALLARSLARCLLVRPRRRRPVVRHVSAAKSSRRWSRSTAPAACTDWKPIRADFLISADGHVLTVWSYVLDTDYITVTLDDGRKFEAKLVGADPRLELAVLKIDARTCRISIWRQRPAAEGHARAGLQQSVRRGDRRRAGQRAARHDPAVTTLDARRGTFETPYQGPVYVLDAMTNNPGAAGGALTNQHGELLGVLGKELRNAQNNIWLNYAIPTAEFAASIEAIRTGKPPVDPDKSKPKKPDKPLTLDRLGHRCLVPDVLERTPPFIDEVRPDSARGQGRRSSPTTSCSWSTTVVQSCGALDEGTRPARGRHRRSRHADARQRADRSAAQAPEEVKQ